MSPLPTPKMPDYDNAKLAAVAGILACLRDVPRDKECGVGVYKAEDGRYYYTAPQAGTGNGIDGMKLRLPRTAKLEAFAHTHPAEPRAGADDTSHAFSPADVKWGKKMGLEMYLGSEKSGRITQMAGSKSGPGGIRFGADVGPLTLDQQALVAALRNPPEQ